MKIAVALLVASPFAATAWMTPASLRPEHRHHATATTLREAADSTTLDGRKIRGDVQPLNNFLLIKCVDAQDQTEGGILLTGKAKVQKYEGSVVAVGPGRTHPDSGIVFDMPVTIGESVVYGKYDGVELDLSGDKHALIRDDDILVKFQGDTLSLDAVDVCYDNVLVYVDKTEQQTEGGILIAKSKKSENRPSTGKVIKVGPGKMASNGELMAMDLQPGDMVKFRDFAGNEVEIEGEDYSVVKMADVLAKY